MPGAHRVSGISAFSCFDLYPAQTALCASMSQKTGQSLSTKHQRSLRGDPAVLAAPLTMRMAIHRLKTTLDLTVRSSSPPTSCLLLGVSISATCAPGLQRSELSC